MQADDPGQLANRRISDRSAVPASGGRRALSPARRSPSGTCSPCSRPARWAPSSFNSQPWRFLYARRDTTPWPQFLGLLNEYNQSWAKSAAALVILVSKTTLLPRGADKEVPSYTHSLDAGAAWANLALQAARSSWAAHGMAGFDVARTATELGVPAELPRRGGHRHRPPRRQVPPARGAARPRAAERSAAAGAAGQ